MRAKGSIGSFPLPGHNPLLPIGAWRGDRPTGRGKEGNRVRARVKGEEEEARVKEGDSEVRFRAGVRDRRRPRVRVRARAGVKPFFPSGLRCLSLIFPRFPPPKEVLFFWRTRLARPMVWSSAP